jgi:hypothetical protein
MKLRITNLFGVLAVAASVAACGSTVLSEPKLTSAKTAVSAAEAVGAVDEPQAALHLKMAQDAIAEAEKHIAEGRDEQAIPLLERALADAQLAREMTAEADGRRSADAAVARLETLQRDTTNRED